MFGFFCTVNYTKFPDKSIYGYAESCADTLRTPSRWVGSLFGFGKVSCVNQNARVIHDCEFKNTFQKVALVALGVFLAVPGQVLAIPLMGFAYLSEEIRLKHKYAVKTLEPAEYNKMKELQQARQKLTGEKKECEPVTCILLSVCCMFCMILRKL